MKKKNTVLIVLIIILFLMVVGLGGFIVYDKVLSNNKLENNNNINDNNEIGEINNSDFVEETKEFNLTTFNAEKLSTDIPYAVDVVVKVYEETIDEKKYYVRLLKSGKINITQDYFDVTTTISNIENVVDVIGLPVRGSTDYLFYFLLSNGDVYYYNLKDLSSTKYTATKVKDISKVEKIFLAETIIKANQPPYFELIAISGNEYIVLDKCI